MNFHYFTLYSAKALLGGVLSDYIQPSHLYLVGSVTLLLAGGYFTQSPFLYNAQKEKLLEKQTF